MAKRDAAAQAKVNAEQAAAEADRSARRASEAVRFHAVQARQAAERQQAGEAAAEEAAREQALAQAEQFSRQAAAERAEAARHAQALRAAELAARRESLEMVQARASTRHTDEGRMQAPDPLPLGTDPAGGDMLAERIPGRREARSLFDLGEEADAELADSDEPTRSNTSSMVHALLASLSPAETAHFVDQYALSVRGVDASGSGVRDAGFQEAEYGESDGGGTSPSWLDTRSAKSETPSAVRETLQHSREKVAARWFALRGLFDPSAPKPEQPDAGARNEAVPVLAIYSVAGGVGKTSLAASLTRALAAQGERVLLVDTTERGILPFYLGARELRHEVVRTFAPPPGSTDRPIHLVSYGTGLTRSGQGQDEGLASKIKRDSMGFSRVVVDVASAATGTLDDLLAAGANVVVPVVPDMNSVVSLTAVRQALHATSGGAGKSSAPAYVLVQFDPSQPLQLDVREVLEQQLGEQLLPFSIRRSPAIAEALAEGMTVIDYAPGEGIAKDYLQLAAWVRSRAEPAREGLAQARWSER